MTLLLEAELTQPRSPGLGAAMPGRCVTKMPGKVRVAARPLSCTYDGSQMMAIEERPDLSMVLISFISKGAAGTGLPKRR